MFLGTINLQIINLKEIFKLSVSNQVYHLANINYPPVSCVLVMIMASVPFTGRAGKGGAELLTCSS